MRQTGESQLRFRELLTRLAKGESTSEDNELLKTRFASNIPNYIENFMNALRLHAKKDVISEYNHTMLRNLEQPVAIVRALHNNVTASKAASDDAQGLEAILWLSSGSRVMLSQNLWTSVGLCNGKVGTVVDIVYKRTEVERSLDDFPLCILVRFNGYTGPSLYDGLLPILPQTVGLKKSSVTCTRKQFPLRLAYAITVHKSQGVTLDKAVVNIGGNEFSLGLTYVALPRVRSLDGLAIDPSFPLSRLLSINSHSGFTAKREALKRLLDLANIE